MELQSPTAMENRFEYEESRTYFAQVGRNLEEPAADEVRELGAEPLEFQRAGFSFKAEKAVLYRVNYSSLLISRVMAPLHTFRCRNESDLYEKGMKIEWERIFSPQETFAVNAVVAEEGAIRHSHYAALKLKDAIADRFREQSGIRPSVDRDSPDVTLHLLIGMDRGVVSLDTSGGALHRRGYRLLGGHAPLHETLAAAVIRFSGWQGETPLLDPMCGSGTLLGEALLSYCRMPGGVLRKHFGFEHMPDFDRELWGEVKEQCTAGIRPLEDQMICGADIDKVVVRDCRTNLNRLPYGRHIRVEAGDFRKHPGLEKGVILCNLPYGKRVGELKRLGELYGEFGDFLKQRCQGSTAWLLTGNLDLIPALRLKPARKIPLFNGPLECRLLKFELY